MHRKAVLLALVAALAYAQTETAHKQTTHKSGRQTNAQSTPTEESLRFRLHFNPHDAAAHKQLIELLRKKNAFRAIVVEDANWLSNSAQSIPNSRTSVSQLL